MVMTVDDLSVTDMLTLRGPVNARITPIARSELVPDTLTVVPISLASWREYDNMQTGLPNPSTGSYLGLYGGTFGSGAPLVRTYDFKGTNSALTFYARTLVSLPSNYVAAGTCQVRAGCGAVTTIADTTMTINFNAYRLGKDNTLGSNLITGGAQSMNSLTFGNKTFSVSASTLNPGDVLDVEMIFNCRDNATGTAVIAAVAGIDLLLTTQG